MSELQNPFGLHTITPYLVVDDAEKLMSFAEVVFDAQRRGEPHYRENGSIQHAEIQIGDSVVMIGEVETPETGSPSTLYIYVDDCDNRYQMALDNGAESIREPDDYPRGDRFSGVNGPCDIQWWIATHTGK